MLPSDNHYYSITQPRQWVIEWPDIRLMTLKWLFWWNFFLSKVHCVYMYCALFNIVLIFLKNKVQTNQKKYREMFKLLLNWKAQSHAKIQAYLKEEKVTQNSHLHQSCTNYFGRRGGLMVSALDLRVSGPGSSPGRGHCVVFLGKSLYSHGASLHPGV